MTWTSTRNVKSRLLRGTSIACAVVVLLGCDDDEEPEAKQTKQAAASATASVKPISPEQLPPSARVRKSWPVPTGPRLAILKGQGVGPIRLGATVETIERLMATPCQKKTDDACRYIGRAVEFRLDDEGVTSEIRIHRMDRPTGDGDKYGVFNGRFPGGADFGMYPHAIIELLGKPDRVDKVEDGGPTNLVEVHHYRGMRLEYDRAENGNVVLGGVVITRPKESAKPPAQ